MKKKKILNIFKYIGVACIGAVIGMGALIGISSCSSKVLNETKAEVDDDIESLTDEAQINKIFNGHLYSFDEGGLANCTFGPLVTTINYYVHGYAYDDNNGVLGSIERINVETITLSGDRVSKIVEIYFYIDDGDGHISYAAMTTNGLNYVIPEGLKFNLISYDYTEVIARNTTTYQEPYYFRFFGLCLTGYDVVNQFIFNKSINNLGIFYQQYPSLIVGYSNFDNNTNEGAEAYFTLLDDTGFYSNGHYFNKIELVLMNAYHQYYRDKNGELHYVEDTGYAFFYSFRYSWNGYDSHDTLSVGFAYINTENGMKKVYNGESFWYNEYYRNINFIVQPRSDQIDLLNMENTYYYEVIWDNDNDVGLSNVFDLLKQAFTSWISIFNIQIVPGITIGLLFFMPLIVGIILLVIWLVKR